MIRILLGQRGTLVREALAAVLSKEDDLQVVAESAQVKEVLVDAVRERPDIVLLDSGLPGGIDVVELCRKLCTRFPDIGVIVILDQRVWVRSGAELIRMAPQVGLIATDASPSRLIEAIHQMASGEQVLDIALAMAALTAAENPLTAREREILRMATSGAPATDIAAELFLSAGTVQNCLSRIVTKTGARTRLEAMRIAQEAGWI